MILAKRFAVLIFTAIVLVLLFHSRPTNYQATLQELSQSVGLGDYLEGEDEGNTPKQPSLEQTQPVMVAPPAKSGSEHNNGTSTDALAQSPFPIGTLKPSGEQYTRAFVTGHLKSENVTWLEPYLKVDPLLKPHIYIVDDQTAPLHTPLNKGHEAMYYLSYILDNYDTLADINIFMHAHQRAWHTPELLNHDALEVLKRLSSERVTREGYMNLRCHWDPGCPERIYPGQSLRDNSKAEEIAVARAWAEMFPSDPIPKSLGAPCCAQFAVSKERIRSIPKAKFQRYRDWLINTDQVDWISGRIFEYFWQKIFADVPTLCPNARACICDGYGVCFTTTEVYNLWSQEYNYWQQGLKELEKWEAKAEKIEKIKDWKKAKIEEMNLEIPLPGGNWELKRKMDKQYKYLVSLRDEALRNGTDPEVRARVAGREWKIGDGY